LTTLVSAVSNIWFSAHQNLNGLHELTTPLPGTVCPLSAS